MHNSIEYTFPFHTCEKPTKGIAQPYSALFNLFNTMMIFYFLLYTQKWYTFLLLFSICIFEAFHLLSHIIHIKGPIQINITHVLAYFMNIAFFCAFSSSTHKVPSLLFMIYLFIVVCIDIYSFFNLSFVYYLTTTSLIYFSLLFYYFPYLPSKVQKNIYSIIGLIGVVILLFLNESLNCKKMLSVYSFPYHIIIESVGIFLFYIICKTFYRL